MTWVYTMAIQQRQLLSLHFVFVSPKALVQECGPIP